MVRVAETGILITVLVSILLLILETVPELQHYVPLFQRIELAIVGIFVLEYIVRWKVAKTWKYPFQGLAIVDLLAILSYLVIAVPELQSLRLFRAVRWFRLFKLTRYTSAYEHCVAAWQRVRLEVFTFLMLIGIFLLLASSGIYYAEHEAQPDKFTSIPHSLWWAIVTMTTVGYGDLYPVTPLGKVIAGCVMLLGVAVIAVPTAFWTAAVMDVLKTVDAEKKVQ